MRLLSLFRSAACPALIPALLLAGEVFFPACAVGAASEPITKGGVRFYQHQNRIEMDGKFCLTEGPIELFACARGGKEYESIITLDANPEILHFCLLLMGLKPGEIGPKFQGDPKNAPTGSPVVVKVKWKAQEGEKIVRGEKLCWNVTDRRPMRQTTWVFVGSKKLKDRKTGKEIYWANVEKSVITVFWDPFAVLDLPLALGANDEAYVVNKHLVPKVGTKCPVILEPGQETKPPLQNAAGGRIFHLDVTAGGRVLVDGSDPADLAKTLKDRSNSAPKDTCRITLDHGVPLDAAANAFEALDAADIKIESVQTTRIRPDTKDAVEVVVSGDRFHVSGVKTARANGKLPETQLKLIVRDRMNRTGRSGLAVRVQRGAKLKTLVNALRACKSIKGVVLRIIWPGNKQGAE